MQHKLQALQRRWDDAVWRDSEAYRPWYQRYGVELARLAQVLVRDLATGGLTLRAMGLVFTTLFALVPLLAVGFSVLKGLGVHNRIEPALAQLLAPMGARGEQLTTRIVGFVDQIDVRVLGLVGLALLIYSAISLIQKIEEGFNYTWNIRRQRSLIRRFSDYFSALTIGPLFVMIALGITASLTNNELVQALAAYQPFGTLIEWLGRLIPYLLVIGAFTFLYLLIPNTRVRLGPALFGGIVAGIAWQLLGVFFATFIASSGRYTAIYSGFAILLLFMIWLNLSWLILLLGSAIAFYRQNPQHLLAGGRGRSELSLVQVERLALALMAAVVSDWYSGVPPPTQETLAQRLQVPGLAVERALDGLLEAGLLAVSESAQGGLLPAVPPETTPLTRVLVAARTQGTLARILTATDTPDGRVMARIEAAVEAELDALTLADLGACEQAASAVAPDSRATG